MDRRKYLTLASGGIVSLAGCSRFERGESPVRDSDETSQSSGGSSDDEPSRLGIRYAGFNSGEVTVKVSDSLGVAEYVELESETGKGATLQVEDDEARARLPKVETAGDPEKRAFGPGEVTAVLYDDADTAVDEASFEYKPELSLGVRPAAGSIYRGATDPKASALFTFSNSGVGPLYFTSFEVRGGKSTIPYAETGESGDGGATFVRPGEAEGIDSQLFEPVGVDEEKALRLAEGEPISYGADGIFIHTGAQPQQTERFKQTFEIVGETALGRDYVFEAAVSFSGGIVELPTGEESVESVYRFENFEVEVNLVESPQ